MFTGTGRDFPIRLCGRSACPLSLDLQIPRSSLIITSLFGDVARFRSNSAYSEFIFSSIVFESFIQRSGMEKPSKIAPAKAQPVGSLTQMGTIRLGKRTDARSPLIKKFVPLAELKDLTFGGWDIFKDNAYQSAANAGVLNPQDLEKVKPFLSTIKPMKAAFDHDFVKMIDGPNIKKGKNRYELALQIKEDIANFRKTSRVSRL